jgi:predicted transcriptional regulator
VKKLDPVKRAAIEAVLRDEPTVSKSEIARRTGLSRPSVGYYLRGMRETLEVAGGVAAAKAADGHHELLECVGRAIAGAEAQIAKLEAMPTGPATAGAIFKGYACVSRLARLKAEMLGSVAQPVQNIYLTRVEALLSAHVRVEALPAEWLGLLEPGASTCTS